MINIPEIVFDCARKCDFSDDSVNDGKHIIEYLRVLGYDIYRFYDGYRTRCADPSCRNRNDEHKGQLCRNVISTLKFR